jgi:hypothetical protein
VLMTCDLGDERIRSAAADFFSHTERKSPAARISPPFAAGSPFTAPNPGYV